MPDIESVPLDPPALMARRVKNGTDNISKGPAMSRREALQAILTGAQIAAGAGIAFTDFRIHDGFSRLLVLDRGMTQRQSGRSMQRLLEIDTYRLMALLALPVAHSLTPWLNAAERELAQITTALVDSDETTEPELLERLTRLEAEIESRESAHHYRFTAAAALRLRSWVGFS